MIRIARSPNFLLVVATLCALLLQPAVASADELVEDNSSPFVQVTGPWTATTADPGSGAADYLVRPPSAGDATVFWPFPATTSAGQYEVFARWMSGPNRATNALYWVSSESGTVAVTQNQQLNGDAWQSLGSFAFAPGKHQGVTLSDRADGVVVAQAVRWVGPGQRPGRGRAAASRRAAAHGSAATDRRAHLT